jgi:hypothetical protein
MERPDYLMSNAMGRLAGRPIAKPTSVAGTKMNIAQQTLRGNTPIDRVLNRLKRYRESGKGFVAPCPAHEDQHPSLSIAEGNDGKVLLLCHAGCRTQDVVSALGLSMADLFTDSGPTLNAKRATTKLPSDVTTRRFSHHAVPWERRVQRAVQWLTSKPRRLLARELGLPPDVMDTLRVGWDCDNFNRPCWTFPEVNGDGRVIGIVRRYTCAPGSGRAEKVCVKGSKRGLSLPALWDQKPGPVFLPEGGSCTLALTAMGLAAVGRPNCKGGVGHATKLLADEKREIVVVGDNDEAGRQAEGFAKELANQFGRPVLLTFPPKGFKDTREWLRDNAPTLHRSNLANPRLQKLGRVYKRRLLAGAKRIEPEKRDPVRDSLYENLHTENLGQADECPELFNCWRSCKRSHMHHMGDRDNRDKQSVVRLSCKRWNCRSCAERKKQQWAERLYGAFGASRTPPQLHVLSVLRAQRPAVQKAIRRAGGWYFCVRHGPSRSEVLVISTVSLPRSQQVEKREAFARAVEAMRKIDRCQGKPISASRGWLPPVEKRDAGMFSKGIVDCSPEEILAGLQKSNVTYHQWKPHRRGAYDFGVSWMYPPEMDDEARTRFTNRLFGRVVELPALNEKEGQEKKETHRDLFHDVG